MLNYRQRLIFTIKTTNCNYIYLIILGHMVFEDNNYKMYLYSLTLKLKRIIVWKFSLLNIYKLQSNLKIKWQMYKVRSIPHSVVHHAKLQKLTRQCTWNLNTNVTNNNTHEITLIIRYAFCVANHTASPCSLPF